MQLNDLPSNDPGLKVTDSALTHLKNALAKQTSPAQGVRIGVKKAGCSGFEYTMALESKDPSEIGFVFSFDGINRANAIINFTEQDPFDPKAVWLNAEHLRALDLDELARRLLPYALAAGFTNVTLDKLRPIVPLIRERIRLLSEVSTVADFFFKEPQGYDPAELIPQKGDAATAARALSKAQEVLKNVPAFDHATIESALRTAADELKLKTGQMFQPVRVAVCGRKNAPPLFETLEVLGRDAVLTRIDSALEIVNERYQLASL